MSNEATISVFFLRSNSQISYKYIVKNKSLALRNNFGPNILKSGPLRKFLNFKFAVDGGVEVINQPGILYSSDNFSSYYKKLKK